MAFGQVQPIVYTTAVAIAEREWLVVDFTFITHHDL